MNIKALREKRDALKEEYKELNILENRSAEQENREAEIFEELTKVNADIKTVEAEERAAKEKAVVEKKSVGEQREMEKNKFDKDFEVRAVAQFIRRQAGDELRAVTEGNNTPGTTSTNGGLLVPTFLSQSIVEVLFEVAPLFAMARKFSPVSGYLEIPREQSLGGPSATAFVGELTNLPSGDFTMDKVRLDQKRVGSYLQLSQQMINDAGIDITGYAINLLSRRLGNKLNDNIINGNKATEFDGILNSASVSATVTTTSPTAIAIEDLMDLYHSMHPTYIPGSVFVVGRPTFNLIAKLKDGMGHFYLQNDIVNGAPQYKLFGLPVLISEVMPAPIAANKAVVLVNMEESYALMIKKGLNLQHISTDTTNALQGSHTILLDGYMDGKIYNENAIKILQMHA